jgi:hypothetical protein
MSNEIMKTPRRKGPPPEGFNDEYSDMAAEPVSKLASRGDMRPEMREESPKERAARRAAEIRGHRGPMDEGTDEFWIDPQMIPEGWTYEWKRRFLLGQEDSTHMVALARDGWEPVPVKRCAKHRAYMPSDWQGATIERKGMILMERPTELTEEIRQMNNFRARKQVRDKEAQLAGTPDGTMTRDDPRVRPQIKKGWEAMPVPKE